MALVILLTIFVLKTLKLNINRTCNMNFSRSCDYNSLELLKLKLLLAVSKLNTY